MIRFYGLFWTVSSASSLASSSFCAANTFTKTQAQTGNNPQRIVVHWPSPPSAKCWPRRSVDDRARRCQPELRNVDEWVRRCDGVGHRERQQRSQRTDCKDIGRGDVRRPDMISTAHTTQHLIHTVTTLVAVMKLMVVGRRPTNLSWHSSFSCLGSKERGSKRAQNWHGAGSSEIAFSTARFRLHNVRLISHRQPGQVGVSSFRRASASRCERQLAHIRWPFAHCNSQTDSTVTSNC